MFFRPQMNLINAYRSDESEEDNKSQPELADFLTGKLTSTSNFSRTVKRSLKANIRFAKYLTQQKFYNAYVKALDIDKKSYSLKHFLKEFSGKNNLVFFEYFRFFFYYLKQKKTSHGQTNSSKINIW
jgi:hypothetical protein